MEVGRRSGGSQKALNVLVVLFVDVIGEDDVERHDEVAALRRVVRVGEALPGDAKIKV